MRVASEDLQLARLWVLAPVRSRYEAAPGIEVCPPSEWSAGKMDEK
jgi:hypothetical protein